MAARKKAAEPIAQPTTGIWSSYPYEFLKHRAWGHHLEDRGSFVKSDQHGRPRIEQELACGCQWSVSRIFNMQMVGTGQQIYYHPPGYSPVPSIAEAREEWFRRFPPKGMNE